MLEHSAVMFVGNVIVSLCYDKFLLLGLDSYILVWGHPIQEEPAGVSFPFLFPQSNQGILRKIFKDKKP